MEEGAMRWISQCGWVFGWKKMGLMTLSSPTLGDDLRVDVAGQSQVLLFLLLLTLSEHSYQSVPIPRFVSTLSAAASMIPKANLPILGRFSHSRHLSHSQSGF